MQRYRIYSREEISYRYCLKSLYIRIINRKINIRIATAVVVSTIIASAAAVGALVQVEQHLHAKALMMDAVWAAVVMATQVLTSPVAAMASV